MKKTMLFVDRFRAKPHDDLSYRASGARLKSPASLDREKRSLDLVIASETPVLMYDWETGEDVPEVLLAKGAIMPAQVPLLDSHSRWSTADVLGSVRSKRVEEGGLVTGIAYFSSTPKAEETFTKYEEGHLTDFSAGYRFSRNSVTRVKKGEKVEIDGRTWKGPVNVVTSWTIKEVSCCPIGADARAKARSDQPPLNDNHKEHNMDPKLRAFLESLGLRSDATEAEAWEYYNNQSNRAQGGPDNGLAGKLDTLIRSLQPLVSQQNAEQSVEQLRKDAIRAKENTAAKERARISAIDKAIEKTEAACGLDLAELRSELINSDTTELEALRRIHDAMLAARPIDLTGGIRATMGKEDREKSREAAVEGLMIRSGIQLDKVKDRQTEYQTMNLVEHAKNRCRAYGESLRGLDPMQILERALSTSDFKNILADVANKALLEGFENAEETFDTWVDITGRVNDFRTHVFARASEAPSLIEVNPDGGEYKYGKMSDTKESVAVVDYGIIVPFTRAAMINDDLGALSDIREKLGAASKRKYGDLCYAILTGNPNMGDGVALFHDTHANQVGSGGAAPSVATLNVLAAKMATQKDVQGLANLNIRPAYILTPWALKGTVDNLLTTTSPIAPGSAASPVVNPWSYLQPVYDARLDTSSAAKWYLAARKGMTIKLFTLGGNMTPVIESKAGWATDGMEFKARITAAAKAMDFRGLAYNVGA